jgi:hypothetical protein
LNLFIKFMYYQIIVEVEFCPIHLTSTTAAPLP